MLELYFATERTCMEIGETRGLIVEESMEGLPIVMAAAFGVPADGRDGTLVTLRLAYNLPGQPKVPKILSRSARLKHSTGDGRLSDS